MDLRDLPAERARIVIVDDHAVVREGLERILAKCADLEVVGKASSGEEALSLAATLAPDLVLLDLSLPGMHGLEVLSAQMDQVESIFRAVPPPPTPSSPPPSPANAPPAEDNELAALRQRLTTLERRLKR